jgi:hypothetical protein
MVPGAATVRGGAAMQDRHLLLSSTFLILGPTWSWLEFRVGLSPHRLLSHCFLCGILFGFVLPIFGDCSIGLHRSSGLAILSHIRIGSSDRTILRASVISQDCSKNMLLQL